MKNVLQVSALMLLLSASIASAQLGPWTSGDIYTVAGDGYGASHGFGGFSGDGGPATSAELYAPLGVTVDGTGNIYIADSANDRIRKVDAATGIITTFAGNGIQGYSGDGGPAIDAEIALPEIQDPEVYIPDTAVAADAAGNIYISDGLNNRIRKVDAATGIITTYVEIPAPGGIAMDAPGNLYITTLNVVCKVDAARIVTTVAGNGNSGTGGDGGPATSAELDGPFQVALDAAGNLYIEEVGYPVVRKVDALTGIITTVAGSGTFGTAGGGIPAIEAKFTEPYGLAVDAAGDIYISDAASSIVWRVDAVADIIEPYAGDLGFNPNEPIGDGGPALSAQVDEPWGLSLDAKGNLYIADAANNRIRVVGAEALAATTTTLTASAVELDYGQPLTLTATVKTVAVHGKTPSGTVSFISDTTWLAGVALNNSGVATLTFMPAGGNYSMTALYNGSLKDRLSVSAPPIGVIVNPDPTTTVLTASANPSPWKDTVTFTATVSSPIITPTGYVSFYDGTTLLATEILLPGGVANYSTMALSIGSHNITADFVANADFNASTSNLVEVISPGDFSISASAGSQSVYTGESVSFTVTITPGPGFNFPVALSCTQLPANSSCSFSPATVNGGTWSSTLVVQTTPPSPATTASVLPAKLHVPLLAGLFLLIIPSRLRRFRKGWPLLLVIFAILASGMVITGCSAPGTITGGTPVGAQTIAVTGISNNGVQILTHTANVTLNVNSLF
jgi:hypothetical protein